MTDTPARRSPKLPFAAVLLVAVAAGLGLWLGQRYFSPATAARPAVVAAQLYPQPRELPAFALEGGDGPIDAQALRGRWTLVFLGFTHCPDICPTTLAELAAAEKQLADLPAAQQPRILFVSADPERDTPQATAEYARHFSKGALGATAPHAVLEPFARSLGMIYLKMPLEGDDYTVDHSSSIALLDPDARLAGVFRPPLDPAKIAADLRLLAGAER